MVRLGDVVVPRHAWVEHKGEKGEPDLAAHFEVRNGRPECVEFTIRAKEDGRGIRSADVHALNIDSLATAVFTRFAEYPREIERGYRLDRPADEREAWEALRHVDEAVRSRRAGVTSAELERVAEVYREHVDSSPTRAVADLLNYSERTAARRVQQAREAGLLPQTTPGKRKA